MSKSEVFLGQGINGEFIVAEVRDNKIRGFNGYHLIDGDNTFCGNALLDNCSWTHNIELKSGLKLSRGLSAQVLDEVQVSDEDKELFESGYGTNTVTCEKCNIAHDSDDRENYITTECGEAFCQTCVELDDLLVSINSAEQVFGAKDISQHDISDLEEVETLFVDSSGFGGYNEPALNKQQLTTRVNHLLQEHGTLRAGLTDIGQFQVYLTLFK